MQRIRMLSLKYSSLIDVLKSATYNIHMEENTVVNLLAIETIAPKWRIARSAGAVYVMLIVLMVGCISIGNLLYNSFQIPRHLTQPILYALIAICGFYLYRRHYICYRYTLTEDQFAIEEVGGRTERTIAVIALADVRAITPSHDNTNATGKIIRASLPPKETQTRVKAIADGIETTYIVSASEELIQKLTAQWKHRAESTL
ncbi:MAG TPA: hypothetical protein VN538_11180 [Clostridia bacterium]|nr:hypothetical protein [Clostridia bacterium]